MSIACIVLPTYNEAENVIDLIPQIFSTKTPKWELHILVVDDNSPDGTAKIITEQQKTYKRLHLIKGKKQGLGVAYIRGFQYAMKEIKPQVILEMDADHSHPPKLIPLFLKATQGSDLVIGSRYIKGGATPDWNLMRKTISAGGNFFARVVAGLYSIHDCTSGFRAIKTSLLKKIKLKRLGAKGYSFQMNLLYECVRAGAKVEEIPLVFPDRTKGKSKMRSKDLIEFFFNSFKLRLRTWERLVKFCIIGGTGVFINTGILTGLTELVGIPYQVSSIFAIESAIIWNFYLNNKWTFKKSKNTSTTRTKLLKFNMVSIVGALINWGILILFTELTGTPYLISNLIGIFVATAWNYLANVNYTWREA